MQFMPLAWYGSKCQVGLLMLVGIISDKISANRNCFFQCCDFADAAIRFSVKNAVIVDIIDCFGNTL